MRYADTINILVPVEHQKYLSRRHKLNPKVNVTFIYNNPDEIEVCCITATPTVLSNIQTDGLMNYIGKYVREYVKNVFETAEVELYETSQQ